MQSQKFNLVPGAVSGVQILGDLFVYESGASAGSSALLVKPENGNEIVLKPGQQFRATEKAGRWFIRADDGVSAITGTVIIGEGEFFDSNTANTFTLDSTFANTVKLNNTTAERVPVTLDVTQQLQISGVPVEYTNKYSSDVSSVANTAIQMLPAVQNVNGAVLEKFDLVSNTGTAFVIAVIAKATQPASILDGDVLFVGNVLTGIQLVSMDIGKNGRLKIPSGLAVWYIATGVDGAKIRDALFTVL